MASKVPLSWFKRCPFKSKVMPTGEHVVVEFDENCPSHLLAEGLDAEISAGPPNLKAADAFMWPTELTLAERKKILSQPVTSKTITQLIPVFDPSLPCGTCTRGNTTSWADQAERSYGKGTVSRSAVPAEGAEEKLQRLDKRDRKVKRQKATTKRRPK